VSESLAKDVSNIETGNGLRMTEGFQDLDGVGV
jgi:hypothetical protein